MHTAATVQFPKSVFKAQGLKQRTYAHPRDVKTGGCNNFTSVVSIVSNASVKATNIGKFKREFFDLKQSCSHIRMYEV